MLPKHNRLPSTVKKVQGIRVNNNNFSLIYQANSQLNCRYRFIISKKIQPSAVRRNKLRRQIYSCIQKADPFTKTLDVVIVAKKPSANLNFQDIAASINQLLVKSQ